MSRDIKLAARARRDFESIFSWLIDLSPRGATSWRDAFWRTVFRVVDDAESFPLADESPRLSDPVCQAIFKTRRGRRYRIVFRFNDTFVMILRVRRPGQRPLRNRDLKTQ